MLNKLIETLTQDSDSLIAVYLIPTILTASFVVISWILIIFLAKIIDIKTEQWKKKQDKISSFQRFLLTYHKPLQKSFSSIRWVIFAYNTLNLLVQFSTTFSQTISDFHFAFSTHILQTLKTYTSAIGINLDKFIHILLHVYIIFFIASWLLRIAKYTCDIIFHTSNYSDQKNRTIRSTGKRTTLSSVTSQIIKVIVVAIASLTILQELGVNVAALIATAGLASVALGFGAQGLIKDMIAGFFILLEDQFTLGDNVDLSTTMGVYSGIVERMTLRMVKLRSNEGSLVTLPNGEIRGVKNYTTDWCRVDFKFFLDIRTDIEKTRSFIFEEITNIYKEFPNDVIAIPEVKPMEKLMDFENKSVSVLYKAFIKTANVDSKSKIESELNQRVVARLKAEGILQVTSSYCQNTKSQS